MSVGRYPDYESDESTAVKRPTIDSPIPKLLLEMEKKGQMLFERIAQLEDRLSTVSVDRPETVSDTEVRKAVDYNSQMAFQIARLNDNMDAFIYRINSLTTRLEI